MLRVHTELTRALDAELEAEHGLATSSYEVLMLLSDSPDGRLRLHELADSVLLSRSGLTRLVDRLEREELLGRAACADDARGSFAVITDLGRERVAAARATHLAGVRERFLTKLSAEEQELLGDLWERIVPGAAPPV